MLDLEASINVMLMLVYTSLRLGLLKEIGNMIQLTNISSTFPVGVINDVLVQVDELIFEDRGTFKKGLDTRLKNNQSTQSKKLYSLLI